MRFNSRLGKLASYISSHNRNIVHYMFKKQRTQFQSIRDLCDDSIRFHTARAAFWRQEYQWEIKWIKR